MNILKTTMYERTYKKCIVDKHLKKEMDKINEIEDFIYNTDNMQELITNSLSMVYGIQKKKEILKRFIRLK